MDKKFSYKSLKYTFLLIVLLMVIFPLKKLYAVSAFHGTFELKQPSGISFEARKRGDEWHNWMETKDGYGIYHNVTTGNWEYCLPAVGTNGRLLLHGNSHAVVGEIDPSLLGIPKGLQPARDSAIKQKLPRINSANPLQKRVKPKSEGGLKSISASGTKHLLVLGVDYSDVPATYAAEQIQPLFFGEENSVSDYYRKTSYFSVTISPAAESYETTNDGFIGWLRLRGNHPNPGSFIEVANQRIARDAILAADPYIDYASYDADGNGIVESTELSIIIIVAGYEASYPHPVNSPSVWAHSSTIWGIAYPSVDGKVIENYAQIGERHDDHLATIGIMAHELGHVMFSLPDLYDTDTSNGDSEGVGCFDLMASGNWGSKAGEYEGSFPTQLSAWSKEYLSWGTITEISSSQTVSFPKSDSYSSSLFRINTSDPNQYFLIENRQFSGYDIGFQGYTGESGHGGLVIYHIDKTKTSLWPKSNTINADEGDKGVDVEEANEGILGYSMLDTFSYGVHTDMFFFQENSIHFDDSTIPGSRLKDGSSTNISVADISPYSDTMTAVITLPLHLPVLDTGSVTETTPNSATLNGTVNTGGLLTTVWFEYSTISGSYSNVSPRQEISGSSGNISVSISISGLSVRTEYYYRLVSQNSDGITYGNEMSFTTPGITLLSFEGSVDNKNNVTITWETGMEADSTGFNLYRSDQENSTYIKINESLIPAEGNAISGSSYNFVDKPDYGISYYKLEDVDYHGASTMYGPINVEVKSGKK
jgi:M6 family metalloprotease-like protein